MGDKSVEALAKAMSDLEEAMVIADVLCNLSRTEWPPNLGRGAKGGQTTALVTVLSLRYY